MPDHADEDAAVGWARPIDDLIARLGSSRAGLTALEAQARRSRGRVAWRDRFAQSDAFLLGRQFANPLTLLLILASIVAVAAGDRADAILILVIVGASGALGFAQERGARRAIRRLRALVEVKARVVRDGVEQDVPASDVVPGDIILVQAGGAIAGDSRLLDSEDLLVDESPLTGESYPAEKEAGVLAVDTPLARRSNTLHAGTHVVAGRARALVVRVGGATELGGIASGLARGEPMTDFEHGVRRLGILLVETTTVLTLGIFAVNVYLGRPVLESLLFALALAVGLTPELLPAILTVNLSHGARRMAERKVVVKRLASIENLGSMTILCCDKTGTLTEGEVRLEGALDPDGNASSDVLRLAKLNSALQAGYRNPIDDAILASGAPDVGGIEKVAEVPYDFSRKRLSVAFREGGRDTLVTKGALASVLSVCSLDASRRAAVEARAAALGASGHRVLGVATRDVTGKPPERWVDAERDLTLAGSLVLADAPKASARDAIASLERTGVALKVVTGDNATVARAVCEQVGIRDARVLTGSELDRTSDAALARVALDVDVFAEVEPRHKERIVRALRRSGEVVGFVGDGINDAPALQAADVGISVDTAVDVAKDAADIVLLERDLGVLSDGVQEGRRTFANTLKYVYMATSTNFGNMLTVAVASIFLPFLPMLPVQILVLNVLNDLPEMAIATDAVDTEQLESPRRWDVRSIRRFMLLFGPLSSMFDALTFLVLLSDFAADATLFRTGWFIESLVSSSLVVLVIRTARSPWRSAPGRALLVATLVIAALAIVLPFTPVATELSFARPSWQVVVSAVLIAIAYLALAEALKRVAFRRLQDWRGSRAP